MRRTLLVFLLLPLPFVLTGCDEQRTVSDLLLERRWPNGVIPYKFATLADGSHPHFSAAQFEDRKERVLAALNGDTAIDGCTTSPCVGWGAANTLRFVECPEDDEHCGSYKDYAYLIINNGYYNGTNTKRGFAALTTAEIDLARCSDEADEMFSGRQCRTEVCDGDECRPKACDRDSGEPCVFDVWLKVNDVDAFMWNAGHELGHMFGFDHEQFRPDRDLYIDTSACADVPEWTNEVHLLSMAHFIGSYDVRSIMHYVDAFDPVDPAVNTCFTSKPGSPIPWFRNSDLPTQKDQAKLQLMYGVRGDWLRNRDWCIGGGREIHVADFDGNDRQDLLCHSAEAGFHATGRRWLDYSNINGHFNGTDWDSGMAQYCWGGSRQLLVGNFDGDDDDDVLCYNDNLGTVTIDYTNYLGELNGQDWPASGTQAWGCNEPGSQAYVGNFDGEEGDDLLCHNSETGSRWIDWADAAGHFLGPDWTSEMVGRRSWCAGTTERIVIGDFNGDGRDDALCHDTETGDRKIDYASIDGDLKGSNWESLEHGANAFCWGRDRTLYAADVDGDEADDLLCHNDRIGSLSIDYATPELGSAEGSGLLGKDYFRDLAFCNAQDAQLVIGPFDPGNSRADLLCHNRATGHKAILYAREDGTFEIPDGY
jgi:hypothetical protein